MKRFLFVLALMLIVGWCGDAFAGPFGINLSDEAKYTLANAANNILKDIGGNGGPFDKVFRIFVYLAGICMIITGASGLSRRDTPVGGAIAAMAVGVMLIGFPNLLQLFNGSIFDQEGNASIVSAVDSSSDKIAFTTRAFVHFSVFMVQVVGFVAVYRGLKTLADVSLTTQRQPQAARAAWIFIIAGVLCINIVGTIKLLATTAAGANSPEIMNWYNRIFGDFN